MHLTQTPVWNAFWVTCCLLALVSVILSGRRRQNAPGRFMGCQLSTPPPPSFRPPAFCCFSTLAVNARPRLSRRRRDKSATGPTLPTARPGLPEVGRPLGPLGSSLGSISGADGVWSSVCHSGRGGKEEKRHFKALIDSCVSQY